MQDDEHAQLPADIVQAKAKQALHAILHCSLNTLRSAQVTNHPFIQQ
jgi:hypothetical protein